MTPRLEPKNMASIKNYNANRTLHFMRILIVHPHLTLYGGAETLLANFCACLAKRGIEYKVMTLSLSESVKQHFDGTEFILPKKSFYFKLSRSGGIEDNLVVHCTAGNGIYFHFGGNFYANNRASGNGTDYAGGASQTDGGGNVSF